MKTAKKAIALILAVCAVFCLPTYASADNTVIDSTKTVSISIYKYDVSKAEADGAWNAGTYVSTGEYDQGVVDTMSGYAVAGVEFMYIRLADIKAHYDGSSITTLYGFSDESVLNAIGLDFDDAQLQEESKYYYSSDTLNVALAGAINANATAIKNTLETYIKANGKAMPVTDEYGHTGVGDLALGLYLVVETRVPENIVSTCNPFMLSLPGTNLEGTEWNYDITIYPKNLSGMPTLNKTVREAKQDTGKNADSNVITDGYNHNASASAGDVVEYQIISKLPTITSDATALSKYSFVDRLSNGIVYNKGDVTLSFYRDEGCTQPIIVWNESSGKFTVEYGEQTMSIHMTSEGLKEINGTYTVYDAGSLNRGYSDCTLKITYACTLKSDSSLVCGDKGNPNCVELNWSRSNTQYTDTLEDEAHVYSYAVDLTKKFSDGKGDLKKVKFILYNDTDKYYVKARQVDGVYYVIDHVSDKTEAAQFVPNEYGKILVKGIEDDQYTATEISTDSNYNLLKSGIKLSINTAEGAACSSCDNPTLTASAKVNDKVSTMTEGNAAVQMVVVNTKGFTLPQTGSYGTWIFTACGVLAMGAAAFMIFRTVKKKD